MSLKDAILYHGCILQGMQYCGGFFHVADRVSTETIIGVADQLYAMEKGWTS